MPKASLAIATTAAVLLSLFAASNILKDVKRLSPLEQVQAGEIILRCRLAKGTTDIPADKVTGYAQGVWKFTNGQAISCITIIEERD